MLRSAARRIGVTEKAVRSRIERGTTHWRLRYDKVGRDVFVAEREAAE